ncbi:TolC family protein [Pedobacter africanus]|uniref:Outer membrane protein TolC n=2 Tax=Pedobacter africanus TaxID=151894 RepID=A0ACC6KUM6_9SPHI|nr:TolC family protein [Pedobacter africanus]MDR6783024.1 outer membrane protein TolC [Pedobacter africanus]
MKPKIYLIMVLLASVHVVVKGQETEPLNYKLSLKAAIDYALTHQTAVLNAVVDEEMARNKVKETVGIGLPQVSASYNFQDFLKLPTTLLPGEFSNPPSDTPIPVKFGTKFNSTAGIELSQLIFDGSYIVGLQASKTYKELSVRNSRRTRIETATAVTKAYYSALVSTEQLGLIDANLVQLSKSLNDTEALFKNGFAEKIDVDRLQVLKNNLETERENVTRLLELNINMLKFQMGMPIQAELALTDQIKDIRAEQVSLGVADTTAYKGRVEYALLETQQKLNELDFKRQKSTFLPSLRGFASASKNFQSDEFSKHFDNRFPTSVIGFTLSWNLINGGQRIYQMRNAKLTIKKTENDMLNLKNGIAQEVSANQKLYLNSKRSVENQERNLALAKEILRVTRIKYEQGVGSSLEVTTAETSLKEAQNNYIKALYDLLITKVDLDKAAGRINY